MSRTNIRACLRDVGITSIEAFAGCSSIDDEFRAIKKSHLKLVLVSHPDKGGDPSIFRAVRDAWDVLKDLYEQGRVHATGFSHYLSAAGSREDSSADRSSASHSSGVPSWEWFKQAEAEPVPPYRAEVAKSGRSECKSSRHRFDSLIDKGELRVGSLDEQAGTYGRWRHLQCWRVPASIWMALPDPKKCADPRRFEAALIAMQQLAFCGYAELSPMQKQQLVAHCMNPSNYAKATKNSKAYNASTGASAPPAPPSAVAAARASILATSAFSSALVVREPGTGSLPSHAAASMQLVHAAPLASSGSFIIPRPGFNGAPSDAFRGKTFVLTGIFPEAGGGAGLNLGKDRVKAMIESFGGRVTGSVSGRTNFVVVGREPGAVKVSAAQARGVPTPDLRGLVASLVTPGASLATAPPAQITSYSSGYDGNALRLSHRSEYQAAPKRKAPAADEPKPHKRRNYHSKC